MVLVLWTAVTYKNKPIYSFSGFYYRNYSSTCSDSGDVIFLQHLTIVNQEHVSHTKFKNPYRNSSYIAVW